MEFGDTEEPEQELLGAVSVARERPDMKGAYREPMEEEHVQRMASHILITETL